MENREVSIVHEAPDSVVMDTTTQQEPGDTFAEPDPPHRISCQTCSSIVAMFDLDFDTERTVELGKVGEILAQDCGHTEWLRNIKYMYGDVPRYSQRGLMLQKYGRNRDCFFGVSYNTKLCGYWSTTRKFGLVHRSDVPHHSGKKLLIDDQWVNLGLVRDWFAKCVREHGAKCESHPIQDLPPFKPQMLIDVQKGCIIECPEDCPRFLTLSYSWGQVESLRTTKANLEIVKRPGALWSETIAGRIPRTIRDAIKLTDALGEAWLWVDSLCILRDDEVSLNHELKQMHRIYATSFLTIIAQDGKNAEHGLRGFEGISKPRSAQQIVIPLSGGERVTMNSNSFESTVPTRYDYEGRMWTFQERLFAKRRLVFASGRVIWQCNCAEWFEDQIYDPVADGDFIAPELSKERCALRWRIPGLNRIGDLVRKFNTMNIEFDEDVFDAFSGIHTYLNKVYPSGLIMGLPEFFFDIALCWFSIRGVRRRQSSKTARKTTSRAQLPSWSWMGWQGDTIFPADLEYEQVVSYDVGFTESVTNWYIMQFPNSIDKEAVGSAWHTYKTAALDSLPDGWVREKFIPPKYWEEESLQFIHNVWSLPAELPRNIYRYGTREENACQGDSFQWYPVPAAKNTTENHETPAKHSEYQYLWCKTSRACISASSKKIFYFFNYYIHQLQDKTGKLIGGLMLHNKSESVHFNRDTTVELIAIAKGWSTLLRNVGENPFSTEGDRQLTSEEEESGQFLPGGKHFGAGREDASSEDNLDQSEVENDETETPHTFERRELWMDAFEAAKKKKLDCYHLLWIGWKDNVAYRKGTAFVLKDDWERLSEKDVEITLG